jgi:hypothetical protein
MSSDAVKGAEGRTGNPAKLVLSEGDAAFSETNEQGEKFPRQISHQEKCF